MTAVSTTIKIVVSMVVVAAMVATRFSSTESSADTKSTGLRGARKLTSDLSNFFGPSSLGAISGFPTPQFPSFTGASTNVGPTTTTTTNFNSGVSEGAGGSGGGAAFGQGSTTFDLDDVSNFEFKNSGSTTSMGGGFGVVGLGAAEGAKALTDIFGPNLFGVTGGSGVSSSGGGP